MNIFKNNLYQILFIVFVVLDVCTTTLLINKPGLYEMNPNVNLIFIHCGLSLGFLVFWMVKFLALESIIRIINYQETKIKGFGYISYTLLIIISVIVASNNIYLIFYYC